MDAVRYYYSNANGGKPTGPVSLNQLRELAAQGVIRSNTSVIREGADEWERFRDIYSDERTREFAGFGLGFLVGFARCVALPWRVIADTASIVAIWGSARLQRVSGETLVSGTLSRVATPILILMWTAWWVGDCICMLVVGRPTILLTLISWIYNFLIMGIAVGGPLGVPSTMISSAARSGITEALTVHEFGDRLAWCVKIGIVGYFLTLVWAFVGELFAGLASLIRIGRTNIRS